MKRSQDNKHSVLSRLVFSLLVLMAAILVLVYRQELLDRYNLWQFKPDATVSAIAQRAAMSDRGKYLFYASRPAVQDRSDFNLSCTTRRSETTAVLGCYVRQRIFLFNVTETRLDGVREVTAAHEMLHAAYERMSDAERTRVDNMLEKEAERITDPDFKALLADYDKIEPGERLNELHSLIGTQVVSIDPQLEAYYSQYFDKRVAVTDLYATYNTVFNQLRSQQTLLSAELEQLSSQISEEVVAYNNATAALDDDIQSFNRKAREGTFATAEEFNAERSRLVARQGILAATRDGLNVTISTFNTKRQQLAAINSQAEALNRSINSNLNALPSI